MRSMIPWKAKSPSPVSALKSIPLRCVTGDNLRSGVIDGRGGGVCCAGHSKGLRSQDGESKPAGSESAHRKCAPSVPRATNAATPPIPPAPQTQKQP